MSVWSVYYDHWAKECNQERKKDFTKTIARRTEEVLTNYWSSPHEMRRVLMNLSTIRNPENALRRTMEIVDGLGKKLSPLLTPEEKAFLIWGFDTLGIIEGRVDRDGLSPGYVLSPTEKRFWKNSGKDEMEMMISCELLTAKQAHRLDAVVALF